MPHLQQYKADQGLPNLIVFFLSVSHCGTFTLYDISNTTSLVANDFNSSVAQIIYGAIVMLVSFTNV